VLSGEPSYGLGLACGAVRIGPEAEDVSLPAEARRDPAPVGDDEHLREALVDELKTLRDTPGRVTREHDNGVRGA
jgi:hypothetical protein